MDIFDLIRCPSCGGRLARVESTLKCEHGHSFDIAKSGYANMLPPGKEKNAHSGDEKTMIRARVDFLSRGYYARISDKVAEVVSRHTDDRAVICDLGCGEGYHTTRIAKGVHRLKNIPVTAVGFDASKYAAECACKLSRSMGMFPRDGIGGELDSPVLTCFMPANIFSTPIHGSTVTAAVSMFAPIPWDEAHRILADGGVLVVVSSGEYHLMEMRQLIYDEVRHGLNLPQCDPRFTEISRENLTYNAQITSAEDIKNLHSMTPFYYKTTEEGRSRLYEREELDVTVEVNVTVFRKN